MDYDVQCNGTMYGNGTQERKTRKSENRNGSGCAMEWNGNLKGVMAMEIGWTTCNGIVVEWIGKR